MGLIRGLIAFIAALSCLYFALLQMDVVSFTYSPLHDVIELNLSLLLLCFFSGGFLSGALIVWFGRFCGRKKSSENNAPTSTEQELNKILNSST